MRYASLAAAGALLFSASLATAGTKVQGNMVDVDVGNPSVSAKSKFKLGSKGNYQFGLKGITDGAGAPAAVTMPGGEYVAIIKGDAGGGVLWEYNILVPIEKEGQAKAKGSVALITSVPVGTAVGVLGAEVHEAPLPANAAACTTILTDPLLPGVYLGPSGMNPCASGARIAVSGVQTEAP